MVDSTPILDPNDWKYRSEGGANLVLAYDGSTPSPLEGKVIRISKYTYASTSRSHPLKRVGFSSEMMQQLLGKEFIVEVKTIKVERSFLERIEMKLLNDGIRPKERELVDGIDLERTEVMMMNDLAFGQGVIGIEIKVSVFPIMFTIVFALTTFSKQPKWGFLSNIDQSFESSRIKSKYCRFCMHQFHKSRSPSPADTADGAEVGYYCPLDLYSNEDGRTRRGLKGLWKQWASSQGQSNNLRFFDLHGKILPGDVSSAPSLIAFIMLSEISLAIAEPCSGPTCYLL